MLVYKTGKIVQFIIERRKECLLKGMNQLLFNRKDKIEGKIVVIEKQVNDFRNKKTICLPFLS